MKTFVYSLSISEAGMIFTWTLETWSEEAIKELSLCQGLNLDGLYGWDNCIDVTC